VCRFATRHHLEVLDDLVELVAVHNVVFFLIVTFTLLTFVAFDLTIELSSFHAYVISDVSFLGFHGIHVLVGEDASLVGNRDGGLNVVTRYHNSAHSGSGVSLDCFLDTRSEWVNNTNHGDQGQIDVHLALLVNCVKATVLYLEGSPLLS